MRRLFSLATMTLVSMVSLQSQAWIEATWPADLDASARTFVVIAGNGYDGVGSLFQQAAIEAIQKIRDQEPGTQVLLISGDDGSKSSSMSNIREWTHGANVRDLGKGYAAADVVSRLAKLDKISGLFFFAHNAPQSGIGLGGASDRLNFKTSGVKNLGSHFTSDAIAWIAGCNSGFNLAPEFSGSWKIPVIGSLTATNFQQLHQDGNFYENDAGLFPSDHWKSSNDQSFSSAKPCAGEVCVRLKPDNFPYSGKWGKMNSGLGFYKFFCGGVEDARCLSGMARFAKLWVGPTRLSENDPEQNRKFIEDFFCPQDSKGVQREACARGIEEALKSDDADYQVFGGQTLQCTLKGCEVNIKCHTFLFWDKCTIKSGGRDTTSTMMGEVKNYLKAFSMQE